jgi:CubicO group peptidase (beta-lactamase class C family)
MINPIPPMTDALKIYGKSGSKTTFGHLGMGSSMAWADSKSDVVTAFTCNGLWHDGVSGPRWCEISDGVWDAIEK